MSTQQIEIVCQGFREFNRGNLAAMVSGWTDDVTFTFPGSTKLGRVYEGRDAVESCFWKLQQLMPGIQIEVINAFDGPDIVAVEWIKRSIAPDGTVFENAGVTVTEFRDGLVTAIRDYMDTEKLALIAAPRKRTTGARSTAERTPVR